MTKGLWDRLRGLDTQLSAPARYLADVRRGRVHAQLSQLRSQVTDLERRLANLEQRAL